MKQKKFLNFQSKNKTIPLLLIVVTLLISLVGCVENGTGAGNSSTTAEITSSGSISSEVSSEEVSVPEGKIDFTNMPEIKIDDLSRYSKSERNDENGEHTYYISDSLIKDKQVDNKSSDLVLDFFDKIHTTFYASSINDKPIDLGHSMLLNAIGENSSKIINIDKDSNAKAWQSKYPTTKGFDGGSGLYLEKKYVDASIGRYFCKDSKNITFESINQNYIKQEQVYTFSAMGFEDGDLPVVLSYTDSQKTVECIFSFAYIQAGSFDIYDKGADCNKIGKYEFYKAKVAGDEALVALPTISDENIAKLDKFKFIFCKQPDGSLKIHRVEYL